MKVRKTPLRDGEWLGSQGASWGKQHCENDQNSFSEFEGDNGVESASGNVRSQALSACLAESQFEGCAAQQPLHSRAAVLLGSYLFKIHWIRRRRGSD
jgi:hypothetical protein